MLHLLGCRTRRTQRRSELALLRWQRCLTLDYLDLKTPPAVYISFPEIQVMSGLSQAKHAD